jgi:hypothetical protein
MASTAELIFHSRFVYADGAIREMVSWKLPQPSPERPRGFKYRLHYGSVYGHSVVRYDNEAGKGDHCHLGGRENPYQFRGVEALVADFLRDNEVRGGANP